MLPKPFILPLSAKILTGLQVLITHSLDSAWSPMTLAGVMTQTTTTGFYYGDDTGVQAAIIARTPVRDEAEILAIATAAHHRRQGLAKAVLHAQLAAWADRTVYLEVAADNDAAMALYCGAGFAAYDRRPQYYVRSTPDNPVAARVDAVLMRRISCSLSS